MNERLQYWRENLPKITGFKRIIRYKQGGISGVLKGQVRILNVDNGYILEEQGCWENRNITIFNSYYFYLLETEIRLAHLRQGSNKPVTLCRFFLDREILYDRHYCAADIYQAKMQWQHHQLKLIWEVKGPNKRGKILTRYL